MKCSEECSHYQHRLGNTALLEPQILYTTDDFRTRCSLCPHLFYNVQPERTRPSVFHFYSQASTSKLPTQQYVDVLEKQFEFDSSEDCAVTVRERLHLVLCEELSTTVSQPSLLISLSVEATQQTALVLLLGLTYSKAFVSLCPRFTRHALLSRGFALYCFS